jgi:hypothetical protein
MADAMSARGTLWEWAARGNGPIVVGARVRVIGQGDGVVLAFHDGLEASTVTVQHDDGRVDEYLTDSHEGDGISHVVTLGARS